MNTFDKITLISAQSLLENKTLNRLFREVEKTEALGDVFDASKELYSYLLENDAKLEKAQQLIERKKEAAEKFKKATGLTWR